MSAPLKNVKILGFTHFAQGPFALQLLGDLGAEVINIERPGILTAMLRRMKSSAGKGRFSLR